MGTLTFTNAGPKLSAAQINALEEQLEGALPVDYREFLLENNGGKPSKAFFRATGKYADPSWVEFFLFVDEYLAEPNAQADPYSLSFARHEWGRFVADDCLIIGSIVRDNHLLLRIRGKRRGHVDIKIMDETELGPPRGWAKHKERGVYPVAKSFSDFLNLLKPEESF
jgi:hypothetical protein